MRAIAPHSRLLGRGTETQQEARDSESPQQPAAPDLRFAAAAVVTCGTQRPGHGGITALNLAANGTLPRATTACELQRSGPRKPAITANRHQSITDGRLSHQSKETDHATLLCGRHTANRSGYPGDIHSQHYLLHDRTSL